MNKEDLKNIVESANETFIDMYSEKLSDIVESAVVELKQHNRSQFLINMIHDLWGIGISKKIGNHLYQYFDLKKRFSENDFVSENETIIGELKCCTNIVDVYYSEEKKCFHFKDEVYISDSVQGLFQYMSSDKSILPVTILPKTVELLTKAGWYKGRNADIRPLIDKYKKEGIVLSDPQIEFMQEFGGIKGLDERDASFEVVIEPKYSKFRKSKPPTIDDLCTYSPLNIVGYNENVDFLLAGAMGDLMVNFWISTDGRLFADQGVQMGRTIMEGFQFILL